MKPATPAAPAGGSLDTAPEHPRAGRPPGAGKRPKMPQRVAETATARQERIFARRPPSALEALNRRLLGYVDEKKFLKMLRDSGDPKMAYLCKLASDPDRYDKELLELVDMADLTVRDLERAWISFHKMVGVAKMAERAPEVLEDIALDSRSGKAACSECGGKGTIPGDDDGEPLECPVCDGLRHVRKPGDRHSREMMLQTLGLIGRPGVPSSSAAVQINMGPGGVPSLEDTLRLAGRSSTRVERGEIEEASGADPGRRSKDPAEE